jgi:hypothetical protein
MRRLVLILLTFIALVTFIRAFDKTDDVRRTDVEQSGLSGEHK